MSDEFYVGYLPNKGPRLAQFNRRVVGTMLVLCLVVAALLVHTMGGFSKATFEFGVERTFEGTLVGGAVPILQIARPGSSNGEVSSYLLVGAGKHGAGPQLIGLDGHRVRAQGTLIYRDEQTMIELAGGPPQDLGESTSTLEAIHTVELGTQVLTGEIVDSKCYLGVMKPGNLKPHRACAVRCISGGVPPVLLVRDRNGLATYFMLVGVDGRAVGQEVLDIVAEPVRIEGRVVRRGGLLFLYADPSLYRVFP